MLRHTDQQGREQLIAEMSDSHLKNTINMLLRNLGACKAILNNGSSADSKGFMSPFARKLYSLPDPEDVKEQAEDVAGQLMLKLPFYIMELLLREKLADYVLEVAEKLRTIIGRSTEFVKPMKASPFFLNGGDIVSDDFSNEFDSTLDEWGGEV